MSSYPTFSTSVSKMVEAYNGKTVLVTGHTGFKGSWLTLWLNLLGARVIGVGLEPNTNPSHFNILFGEQSQNKFTNFTSIIEDIRSPDVLKNIIDKYQPRMVFHLAAQALVRYSYQNPLETWSTNVIGTVNLLEAIRQASNQKSQKTSQQLSQEIGVVVITSDKCYQNNEWVWGYRENDPLGGKDPYSASKAAAEMVVASYRNSFFSNEEYGKTHNCLIASARAGNVIGGGDWSSDRLIPDIIRAIVAEKPVLLRNPSFTRPWQHVLEPLYGYLLLGKELLSNCSEFADAWNFGPEGADSLSVSEVFAWAKKFNGKAEYYLEQTQQTTKLTTSDAGGIKKMSEARLLRLDSAKANSILKWRGRWNAEDAIKKTLEWYSNFYQQGKIDSIKCIEEYMSSGLV